MYIASTGFINVTVCFLLALMWVNPAFSKESTEDVAIQARGVVNTLSEPLYTPFVERYVLDDLKQLRTQMASQKHELLQQILDREHKSIDRAVAYATDTVTYFFYLIAAASSILVIVGWTSIRDIKDRVHSYANDEISKLIAEYEGRLKSIEKQLKEKSQDIEDNREEIELTQEVQSLWQRAAREHSIDHKISVYDEILLLKPDDTEAMIYKADAVLELPEPQWAINLCMQALKIDPQNQHAFFQLACAHAQMGNQAEAINLLAQLLEMSDAYLSNISDEVMLKSLYGIEAFDVMMARYGAAG